MSKYLVTGGVGFIGSHIVEELLNRGDEAIVIDDLSSGNRDNIPASVKFIEGDICDKTKLSKAMEGVDGIFHMAAIASVQKSIGEWLETHRTNLTGTIQIFDLAKKQKIPVVFASSAAIYGDNQNLPLDENEKAHPLSAYGADKYGCELHGFVASHVHKVPNVGCRFFNVYGPRQDPSSPYSGVISIFASQIGANQPITVFGDGKQTRDFIHVKDVVRALFASMEKLRDGSISHDVFNVCTGRSTDLMQLAKVLMDITGNQINVKKDPPREGDIQKSLGNPSKMNRILGVSADILLKNGLKTLL